MRSIAPLSAGRLLTEAPEVADAVARAGRAEGLSAATINRRLAILRRVCRLAFRVWGWLEHDIAGRIRLLGGETARLETVTEAQARALIAAATDARIRAAIVWAASTGLRKGELLAVTPESFRDGSVVVERSKTGRPRVVPLAAGLDPKGFPFGLREHELDRGFRRARDAAGLPWLQFRDLRRTFGSWLIRSTGNLRLVQMLLGHTTPTITARHYAHLLDDGLRDGIKTLPVLVGQTRVRKKKAA